MLVLSIPNNIKNKEIPNKYKWLHSLQTNVHAGQLTQNRIMHALLNTYPSLLYSSAENEQLSRGKGDRVLSGIEQKEQMQHFHNHQSEN